MLWWITFVTLTLVLLYNALRWLLDRGKEAQLEVFKAEEEVAKARRLLMAPGQPA